MIDTLLPHDLEIRYLKRIAPNQLLLKFALPYLGRSLIPFEYRRKHHPIQELSWVRTPRPPPRCYLFICDIDMLDSSITRNSLGSLGALSLKMI